MGHIDEKIAFLIPNLRIGGSEMKVLQLSAGLRLRGFDVRIVCRGEMGEIADRLREEGFSVQRNPMKPYRLDQLVRFTRFLRRNGIRVVHSYNYGGNFTDALAVKLAGACFVSSRENMRHWDLRQRLGAGERIRNRLTDEIIAISAPVRDLTLRVERVPAEAVQVITNGVPLEEAENALRHCDIASLKGELGVPSGRMVFGTLSNLRKVKGNDVLIKGFAELVHRTKADVHLCIFGHGEERASLELIVQENRIGDRVTLNFVDRNRFELMSIFDVFLLGSLNEGYSLAIMEAMALGKPVIATNVGGNTCQVDSGHTGLLVPPNDPQALADAMENLLSNDEARRQMGQRSMQKALRDFGADRMIEMHEKLYRGVIQRIREK